MVGMSVEDAVSTLAEELEQWKIHDLLHNSPGCVEKLSDDTDGRRLRAAVLIAEEALEIMFSAVVQKMALQNGCAASTFFSAEPPTIVLARFTTGPSATSLSSVHVLALVVIDKFSLPTISSAVLGEA